MSYLVLARKYRPQTFSDLTGQETISSILKAAISQNRVAHAYLFSGPRGIGKTTSARIFAKALNCTERTKDVEPCGTCASCEGITKGSSLDVLELDAASHTQVEKIREVIIDSVAFAPVHGKYKIFIIDEVHMLSTHSFNALLKTLEEPPSHVVFVLATTDFHKIPTTIASRCQRFRFLPMTIEEIVSNLTRIAKIESISVSDDAFAILARAAGGAMRDALSLFDQVISSVSSGGKNARIERASVESILGVVKDDFLSGFLNAVADQNAKGVLEATRQILNEGYDLSFFLKELRESYRQMLIHKCGFSAEDATAGSRAGLPVDRFTREQILRDIQLLTRCADLMRWNDLPHVVFESYAVRLCEKALPAEEILERLKALESAVQKGGGTPSSGFSRPAPQASNPGPVAVKKTVLETQTLEPKAVAAAPTVTSSAPVSAPAPAAVSSTTFQVEVQTDRGEAVSLTSDVKDAWKRTLAHLAQHKPSLHSTLLMGVVAGTGDRLSITFYKPFGLDVAKRNLSLIESVLSEQARKRITLNLTLGKAEDRAEAPPETVVDRGAPEEAPGDTFEVLEPAESGKDLFAGQDEGVKKFMELFPGAVAADQPQ